MKKGYLFSVLVLSLFIGNTVALADSMRCGNKVVKSGDSTVRILLLCGEPLHKEVLSIDEEEHSRRTDEHKIEMSKTVKTERWTYNLGAGTFLKLLTIRNGVLESIENGKRM